MRSQSLVRIKFDSNFKVDAVERLFEDKYGRFRDVKYHNNSLYVLTSNRDGRGNVREGDDKILRIWKD
jgi:glucose/arabinose dehydrogenase